MLLKVLPEEVWLEILRCATLVPYLLDASPPDVFGYSAARRPEVIRHCASRSLSVKLSIILVCKRWYTLALPFLYEAIVIRRPVTILRVMNIPLLTARLKDSLLTQIGDDRAELLRWTLRVDFDIKSNFIGDWDHAIRFALRHMLQKMTRLEIFTVTAQTLPEYLLDRLVTMESRSLRILDVISHKGQNLDPVLPKLCNMLHRQPLRSLRIATEAPVDSNVSDSQDTGQVELPNVEFLRVPGKILQNLQLSNPSFLTHFCIGHNVLIKDSMLTSAFEHFGKTLLFVEIPNESLWHYGPNPPQSMMLMQDIASWSPKLQSIVITFKEGENPLLPFLEFLPPVSNLGFRMVDNSSLAAAVWSAIMTSLPTLLHNTPSVKVIRVISRPSFLRASLHEFRTQRPLDDVFLPYTIPQFCRATFDDYSVRFEDLVGRSFSWSSR